MHLAQVFSSEVKCCCNDPVYNLCCLDFGATFITGCPLDSVLLLALIPCLASGVSILCGNRYEMPAGTAIQSRHAFIPDTALSPDLSINSWAFMDSHVLSYLCFAGKCTKMSALETLLLLLHEYFMFLWLSLLLSFCILFIEWSLIAKTKVALISLQRMIVVVVRNLLCLKSVKQETLLLHYLSNFGGFGLYIS